MAKRAKVVFIGAGSLGFTRGLVRDMLTYPRLRDAELALVDIHPGRLEFARRACEKIIAAGQYPATVTASTDRRKVMKDADAVCVTILCGSTDVWKHDILIPKKYGIDINIGDTRGVAGIFRALRTIPELLGICRDMEKLCPRAILLNYTNPMAMNCLAMQRSFPHLKITGLCHSVQGTAWMLAQWIGVKPEEVDYVCAGINHMSWYLQFKRAGKDLYPKLRKTVATNRKIYNDEQVRNEMFLALDYYVTESSGHNSEYNWWFRKRPDLIKKYCTTGTGWNPGAHAYILKYHQQIDKNWRQSFRQWLESKEPIDLARGNEYASGIINAYCGGELFKFNGNVPNRGGLVTNLPPDCCVEVPVVATRGGFEAVAVGALPASCAMLTGLSAQIEVLAVDACLEGDPRKVWQAVAHSPLTAAKLSLAESRKMTQEMLNKYRRYLPTFPSVKI